MNAFEILVIILSGFLALFLLIAIILGALMIRVTLQIKKVATTAERAANNMEAIAGNVSNIASKAFLGKLFLKVVKRAKK